MRPCIECGEARIQPHTRKTVCSTACQNLRRERQRGTSACTLCDRRMSYKAHAESPLCVRCRTSLASPESIRRRVLGRHSATEWDCADCGVRCSRLPTKGQAPKWCEACRVKSRKRDWIPRPVRFGVYARDGWTCWLCEGAVDAGLIGSASPWRASLDHIVPRSQGGSNDETNLRMAHVWCNTVRNDGRTYSPEDFRVSA